MKKKSPALNEKVNVPKHMEHAGEGDCREQGQTLWHHKRNAGNRQSADYSDVRRYAGKHSNSDEPASFHHDSTDRRYFTLGRYRNLVDV